jgi:hypothetical protein
MAALARALATLLTAGELEARLRELEQASFLAQNWRRLP